MRGAKGTAGEDHGERTEREKARREGRGWALQISGNGASSKNLSLLVLNITCASSCRVKGTIRTRDNGARLVTAQKMTRALEPSGT